MKKGLILIALLSLCIAGCGVSTKKEPSYEQKKEKSDYEMVGIDAYDSMDVAIVHTINYEEKNITFVNTTVSLTYTLEYDGTTKFFDKNGLGMSVQQIHPGDVVEVTFYKNTRSLNTLQLYKDAWVMENVNTFEIASSGKVIEIYQEKYRFTDNSIVVMPYGLGELMDINTTDTITVTGIGHDISSIRVTKGHGYLRLTNDSNVIGGWIEVGNHMIQPISEDMLLVVPEGEYPVTISLGNASLKETVAIKRDLETIVDCKSFEPEQIRYGSILFTVDPENTSIYIDGSKADISAPVELSYGIHQMIARAPSYQTLSKYIKVGSEYATLAVLLEESPKEEEEEKTSETTEEAKDQSQTEESEAVQETEKVQETNSETLEESKTSEETKETTNPEKTEQEETTKTEETVDTSTEIVSTSYRVYIDAPCDVEIYLDGAYIGLSPVNFKKTAGTHTITLRKVGYVTRSYTIQVDEEEKDISYSFSELEKNPE